ncbi:MAG: peptidoglycan recognition family protein [Planctomycetia bacterium]|jgi:N-acetyl-anhydromuramyl-L-alanine amidase AmpD
MLTTIAYRLAAKAAVRGAVFAAAISIGDAPMVDLRGKLATNGEYPQRDTTGLKYIIIHHTATRGQTLRSISEFHVEQRKWAGIAYHFAVGHDATKFLLNDVDRRTNHAQGINTRSIGIALIGNYDTNDINDGMVLSTMEIIERLRAEHGPLEVLFHSDTKPTDCPGRFARMKFIPILYIENL